MPNRIPRRDLIKYAGAFSAATLAGQADAKPNVLFVAVDDLDCRIAPYGDPVAITPGIDRLARRGVRFDRAYCQFPLCNPTRSSVLSGRYPTSTGVLDNNTFLRLGRDEYTMPEYFARNGYATALHGKIWHPPNQGLRHDQPKPKPQIAARTGQPVLWYTPQERARQQAEQPAYWDSVHSPYRNMIVPDPAQYAWANEFGPLVEGDPGQDARIADQGVESLKSMAAGGRPFFLAVGFHKPHVPLKAPQQYFDMYDVSAMPLPPDFDTEPRQLPGMPRDEFRMNIDLYAGRSFTALEARQAMRAYYACVSYMDAQVGRLLDQLETLRIADNTIIVLWGDHGWHLSEKGMWAKGTLFEISARGPLIIADPSKSSAGRTSPRVVQYLDMYPTLLDLCGLPTAPWTEGVTLAPLLSDPNATWNRPAYTVQTRNWSMGRSVRNERWRYTEWDEGRRGKALFDHDHDPHETRNMADRSEHAALVAEMAALLRNGPVARTPQAGGLERQLFD